MATETDGFAELVRDLKERSGLSYGALAKKLHVSTSTLHRYCNGDAVPTEFAPVERLGRLCGASREELIALHRGWILADEARRRGKAAAATPEPAAGPGQGTVSEAPGASGTGSGQPGEPGPAEPAEPVESRPETTPPGPAAADGASAAGAESSPAVGPRPGSRPEREPGSGSGADADVLVTVRPPAPTGAGTRKRLRTVLAAAAVVALAVPVAYAVSRPDDGDADAKGDGRRKAAGAATAVTGAAGTPTPSAASGTPSASSTTPGSATPSTPAKSSAPVPHAVATPVSVGISSYNWESSCGQFYVLGRQPGEVPPPPAPQDARGWARALGGVDGGHMQLQLTVTGKTAEAVVLNALHVRVVERSAPLDRAVYAMGDGCGGGITPQTFDIDLDASRPFAQPVAGRDGDGVVPAKDFPYKVSTSDPEVFNLDLHTESHVVSWYLEVDWSSGDRHGTLYVKDDGKPFRTSAIEGKKTYNYLPDKGEWVTY
ncbi:transcriptional regulator [Streptomyces sp. MS191]|uniref:transcriptional regulator n=1 Tax=Streptomyces sp. ms191 TaxID=1827978 RepID=UPI0021C71B3F|nr:transcriptional regulator [Streptomyces sp. ms191]